MTSVDDTRQAKSSRMSRSCSPLLDSRTSRTNQPRTRSRSALRAAARDSDRDGDRDRERDRSEDRSHSRRHEHHHSSRRHHHHHREDLHPSSHRSSRHNEGRLTSSSHGKGQPRLSTKHSHSAPKADTDNAPSDAAATVAVLPYGARRLTKSDFAAFEPLLAHYLELHKALDVRALDAIEVRGRWKSFMGKWNRGELPEGWYEPELFLRVAHDRANEAEEEGEQEPRALSAEDADMLDHGDDEETVVSKFPPTGRPSQAAIEASRPTPRQPTTTTTNPNSDSDSDSYGPSLPPIPGHRPASAHHASTTSRGTPHGPGIPRLDDLTLRAELDAAAHADSVAALRQARKADRAQQKEALDELVPRADPGSRERMLEKKRAVNDKMRAFREPSPGGEVPESELLGDGDGGLSEHKRMVASMQQKVSERQLRREEARRAKNAERDERIGAFRAREEKTIETLRELARRRFG
ncbi:hypothetical protein B0T22DRAFT_285743 [Podospora appendiculata]|uniref:Uncharacterized protein n=1 Tax=Podospora appendiculata TaxID=314037 RepID=A0AAE0X0W4_9PEZI|nr:hypothetical protein B0T22DRAFT_285743 [Podospora appendiculata]